MYSRATGASIEEGLVAATDIQNVNGALHWSVARGGQTLTDRRQMQVERVGQRRILGAGVPARYQTTRWSVASSGNESSTMAPPVNAERGAVRL